MTGTRPHNGYYVTKDDVNRLPAWYSALGWTCCGRKDRNNPCVEVAPDKVLDQEHVDEVRKSLMMKSREWMDDRKLELSITKPHKRSALAHCARSKVEVFSTVTNQRVELVSGEVCDEIDPRDHPETLVYYQQGRLAGTTTATLDHERHPQQ